MRLVRAHLALAACTLFSGCGYIHFGRMEKLPASGGDAALAAAYSNLATEHKILKQELVLARKEGDAFRVALERGGAGASADVVARLADATKELAALRASYTKLQAERSAPNSASGVDPSRMAELEDKLAASLRNYTQLQDENARLRGELDRTRSENTVLADRLKDSVAQNEQANHALDMLNVELLAQKQARAKAEQASEAYRTQLGVIVAQRAGSSGGSPTEPPGTGAASPATLALARAPSAEATPTAELRLNTERLRQAAETVEPAAPASPRPRIHVVEAGDTLEKISLRYYGSTDQWRAIYNANLALLNHGQPIRIGMELQLP